MCYKYMYMHKDDSIFRHAVDLLVKLKGNFSMAFPPLLEIGRVSMQLEGFYADFHLTLSLSCAQTKDKTECVVQCARCLLFLLLLFH